MQNSYKNVLLLVSIAFALSIQLWLVSIFTLVNFPQANVLTKIMMPEWLHEVRPERDALHFHFFVFCALALTAAIVFYFHRRINEPQIWPQAKLFLGLEMIWTFFTFECDF